MWQQGKVVCTTTRSPSGLEEKENASIFMTLWKDGSINDNSICDLYNCSMNIKHITQEPVSYTSTTKSNLYQ